MLQSITSQDMVTSFLDLLYQLSEEKLIFQVAKLMNLKKNIRQLGSDT